MPLRDGTGPLGQGPKTGRGQGNCSSATPQDTNAVVGRGMGRGMGCGRGCGRGMGRGMGQAINLSNQDQK